MHHSTYRPVMSILPVSAASQSQWMRLRKCRYIAKLNRMRIGRGRATKDAKLALGTIARRIQEVRSPFSLNCTIAILSCS
ncbi:MULTISPECIES: hypothetical protein [unclassified Microcoleus]|uniref:hypothetical protein n=1 Tax=unclassified Microcoleus TaxID=2642155 RepID=UPI002FCF1C4C